MVALKRRQEKLAEVRARKASRTKASAPHSKQGGSSVYGQSDASSMDFSTYKQQALRKLVNMYPALSKPEISTFNKQGSTLIPKQFAIQNLPPEQQEAVKRSCSKKLTVFHDIALQRQPDRKIKLFTDLESETQEINCGGLVRLIPEMHTQNPYHKTPKTTNQRLLRYSVHDRVSKKPVAQVEKQHFRKGCDVVAFKEAQLIAAKIKTPAITLNKKGSQAAGTTLSKNASTIIV